MRLFLLVIATMLAVAGRASAHAPGAECKLHADRVEVEAYYDDDSPARDARVHVEDEQKRVVAEGRTDAKGRWSFPRPRPGRYVAVIDAGAGHRTQLRIMVPGNAQSSHAPVEKVTPTISEGPRREEFTRFPWLKVGIGVAVIGGLALAFWALQCRNQRP